MAKNNQFENPFYALLLAAGVVFAITACAFWVMTLRADKLSRDPAVVQSPSKLNEFMDKHGVWLLTGELAVLAVVTIAAIGTDDYWSRRSARRDSEAAANAAVANRESMQEHA